MFRRNARVSILMPAAVLAMGAALLLIPPAAPAGTGRDGTIAATNGKAGTADELAKRYDSGPCAECHREIFEQWSRSTHAASLIGGGRTAAALRAAVNEGLVKWPASGVKTPAEVTVGHLMPCAKCHLPQLAEASDNVAREIVEALQALQGAPGGADPAARQRATATLSGLNIGCLICHNRNAVIHKMKDGYPPAGAVYGRKEGAHPGTFPLLKKGEALGESIFCGQCHGYGPNFDLDNPTQCATGYGSYLFSYVQEGGREACQDCHMRKNRLGHEIRGPGSPVMENAALAVTTETYAYQFREGDRYIPRVVVNVTLTNKAGHAIPEGPPSAKRLVLEVSATSGEGSAPFWSGSRSYGPVAALFGRSARVGNGPHDSSGVIESSALLPHRTVRERFEIVPPASDGPPGPVSVTVKVRHLPDGTEGAQVRDWYAYRKVVAVETALR